jgi:ankyrin repeat protein
MYSPLPFLISHPFRSLDIVVSPVRRAADPITRQPPPLATPLHLAASQASALFVWLISHQPTVLFSQNKPATSNQRAVLFFQNKSASAIRHQPNEQAHRPFERPRLRRR